MSRGPDSYVPPNYEEVMHGRDPVVDPPAPPMEPFDDNAMRHVVKLHKFVYDKEMWNSWETTVAVEWDKQINEGSCRKVFRMKDLTGNAMYVMKVAKDGRNARAECFAEVAMQAKVAHLAKLCSEALHRACPRLSTKSIHGPDGYGISYLSCYAMEIPDRKGPPGCGCFIASVEPLIQGKFRKYTNNYGFVHPKSHSLPLAFSHWTYCHSRGEYLACDLQGIRNGNTEVFTDPQILSNTPHGLRYGKCDLGVTAIEKFFQSHTCNDLCVILGIAHSPSKEARDGARAIMQGKLPQLGGSLDIPPPSGGQSVPVSIPVPPNALPIAPVKNGGTHRSSRLPSPKRNDAPRKRSVDNGQRSNPQKDNAAAISRFLSAIPQGGYPNPVNGSAYGQMMSTSSDSRKEGPRSSSLSGSVIFQSEKNQISPSSNSLVRPSNHSPSGSQGNASPLSFLATAPSVPYYSSAGSVSSVSSYGSYSGMVHPSFSIV